MTLRFLSSTTISDGLPSARRAVAIAFLALAGATVAHAAPDAASAAAGDQAAPLTITVRPGQSLNDIAVAVTQSHDPAVLARAGRALFDANPQAFMKRDPSRLKIGAQLTVPTLDATGAAAGAAASGAAASGAVAASASASASGAASHAAASAAPAAASHPAATSAASHAAAALAASAAAGTASSANGASAPGAASAHAPSAVAQSVAPAASSGVGSSHVWSGSIQQAPAAASGASAAGAEALLAPGAANQAPSGSSTQAATGASQARPSSLQQLLALKNRVLMELQKHGIGKPAANGAPTPAPAAGSAQRPQASAATSAAGSEAAASEAATAGSTASAASAPAVTPPVSAAPRAAAPQLPFNSGAAIAVGAAVVALIAGFALRRRKKGPPADAIEPGAFTPAPALDPDAVAAIAGAPAEPDAAAAEERREAGGQAATAAAHHESPVAPPAEAKTAPTTTESTFAEPQSTPAIEPDIATTRGPQTPPVEPLTLKMPQPDERGGAPRAPESDDAQSGVPQTGAKPAPYAWRQAFPHDAIAALDSLDMPLPPRASTSDDAGQAAESQHAEPADSRSAQKATNGQAAARQPIGAEDSHDVGEHGEATPGADRDGGESRRDETPMARPWAAEPHQATPSSGAEHGDAAAQAAESPAIESQPEGQRRQAAAPHEAGTPGIALPNALSGRAEPPSAASQPGASFAAPSPAAPRREPAASPNLPPLGVAQFGALNLDFDLDLPTGPSASLPAFTPEALAKIARNKLELASEYVELGDLAGARTLLHEVIEAGHADTRDEAHVMLAKLADLS
ncbi:FimV/HubP family polar landmark protein [Burkholderia oklahomensis]|uniref:FimV/HubP family polar landmark protein n=3 Tax=Burkholderia oklahomensis TaxID=342113 RepID=UPI0005D9AB68|nr:FimV/HubP family polar landmark protein [Burkholderia oklahomensis]AJX35875.1 putative transmembrane protein [Burkholderia oklahomensis C6786]AOI48427.1 hypothetical protein WI23_21385 [Burkholderia oklahomensis C6786]KUY52235.1 hypothetical protein WI23_24925 [Burkholderia oklahomensis C6786]MBI0363418.1 hypothetical protein [Burkholderia oklahomensis]SUY27537.1 Tfp pilus assembly protein FimV [Burkholderia oklahomensis]